MADIDGFFQLSYACLPALFTAIQVCTLRGLITILSSLVTDELGSYSCNL